MILILDLICVALYTLLAVLYFAIRGSIVFGISYVIVALGWCLVMYLHHKDGYF